MSSDGKGGGGGGEITVGYRYFMGVQLAVCHGPVDSVKRIIIGEREAWSGSVVANETININKPELFGGESREGGVVGDVDIEMGHIDQGRNAYLSLHQSDTCPAYRGVLSLVFKAFMWSSMNPYFKSPWPEVTRILAGWNNDTPWNPDNAVINTLDMNPAHIIYQCLTDPAWGMGYSTSEIGDSFAASATTLKNEGFGLSLPWDQQSSIEEFVGTILDHINGAVGVNMATGKFELKLIRDDYDVESLVELNESNVIQLQSFQRAAFGDGINEVIVVYVDRDGYEKPVGVQNLASIAAQGGVISTTKRYPGIRDADLAARVAMRDLTTLSSTLALVTLTCNRVLWDKEIGDVVKFSWNDFGLAGVPFRITKIDKGTLTDSKITVTMVEDAFGLPTSAYTSVPPSQWVDNVVPPVAADASKAVEAPYWEVVKNVSLANQEQLQPEYGFGMFMASRGAVRGALGYDLSASADNVEYANVTGGNFSPRGTLSASITATQTSITLSGAFDLDSVVLSEDGGYAYIENECVSVVSCEPWSGVVIVKRGVLDTVPVPHSVGAQVFFKSSVAAYDPTERVSGETVYYKPRTKTGIGTLALDDAEEVVLTFSNRASRPYPPGNVKINGQYYPESVPEAELVITWAHRDRVAQTVDFVDHTVGNIGPEEGVSYRIKLYNGNTLLRTYDISDGSTRWAYPSDDDTADGLQPSLRIKVMSVRDGLESWQAHECTVTRLALSGGVVIGKRPDRPTLTATAGEGAIELDWEFAGPSGNLEYTEIRMATVPVFEESTLIRVEYLPSQSYNDPVSDPLAYRWYWARVADENGLLSDWSDVAVGGGIFLSEKPATPVLDAISDPSGVLLSWEFGDLRTNILHTEIRVSDMPDFNAASTIKYETFPGAEFLHQIDTLSAVKWYWARVVDVAGLPSDWSVAAEFNGVSDTTPATPSITATKVTLGIALAWEFGDERTNIANTEIRVADVPDVTQSVQLYLATYPDTDYLHELTNVVAYKWYWARVFDINGHSSAWSQAAVSNGVFIQNKPATPTLIASAGAFAVILTWEFGDIRTNILHTEILMSTTPDFIDGAPLDIELYPETTHTHEIEQVGVFRWYWVRVRDLNGLLSDWSSVQSARPLRVDPTQTLEALEGQIAESQLAGALNERIDLIDTPVTGLVDQMTGVKTDIQTLETVDASLASQINTVSAVANGKNKTFYQTTSPTTGMVAGDLWFDSDDFKRTYRYNGIDWVETSDTRIATNAAAIQTEQTARADADSALASQITTVLAVADSKNKTYRQATAPSSGMASGDIWYDSDDGDRAYRYSGSTWVETSDTRIAANAAAIQTEQTARADADSALASQISTVSAVANGKNKTYTQAGAPSSGMVSGDIWYDSDDGNRTYRYNGTDWVETSDTRIATNAAAIQTEQTARADADSALASQVTTVQAIADSKNKTYTQAEAPTSGMSTGDIWYDSDDGNRTYRYNGSAWVDTSDARIDEISYAAIQETLSVHASEIDGLQGQYTLKVDLNGNVTGFGFASTDPVDAEPYSEFTILANAMKLFSPTGESGPKMPFAVVEQSPGVWKALLNSDVLIGGNVDIANLTTGALQNDVMLSLGGGVIELDGAGEIRVFKDLSANADHVKLSSGELRFLRYISGAYQTYNYLSRIEAGSANNNTQVTIPGYWKSQPRVMVSPSSLSLYKATYANQDQGITCTAGTVTETSAGSGVWQFTPVATLNLAANTGGGAINNSSGATSSNSWTSATQTTPANCNQITPSVSLQSQRGNGASQYYYRSIKWRVEYYSGGTWVAGSWRTVNMGAQFNAVSDSVVFDFPSAAAWQWRIYSEALDTDGTVFGSISYDYTSEVVYADDINILAQANQGAGGPTTDTETGTSSFGTPSGSGEIYKIDYSWTATWNGYCNQTTYPGYQEYASYGITSKCVGSGGTTYDSASAYMPSTHFGGSAAHTHTVNGSSLSFNASAIWGESTTSALNFGAASSCSLVFSNMSSTVYRRTPQANSTTASNTYTLSSYTYNLTSAQVLATGALNWLAVGE